MRVAASRREGMWTVDGNRFDRFTRGWARGATRRGAIAGLASGLLLSALPDGTPGAERRRDQAVHGEKKRKKCTNGLLKCTIKKGRKKKRFCVDAQTDPANCGGCGILCAIGQGCQGGVCTCNGTICAGCCDGNTCEAGTSNQLCGANGAICQACSGGRTCQNGVCACPAGQTSCGGACVDTKTNAANCGACGNACPSGQSCQNGGCVCPAGQTKCAGECVDTQTDVANCGTCGNDCGGGNDCNTVACNLGACQTTPNIGAACNGGLGSCNDSGQCIATVCAGKTAANPCFERDASFCNAANTCNCGADLNGNVACFENAYCNNGTQQCASNADCVNLLGFPAGSICFSATNCCIGATGCTTPCPT